MRLLKHIPPALSGVSIGIGLIGAPVAQAADQPGRVGSFRTELGQLTQGLTIALAQGVRYDSNLVRTANSAETLAIYGTDDASDWISQTSLNVDYEFIGKRTKVRFGGDVSYAEYAHFDQYSGFVTGGSGAADWQFTDRCSTGIDGRIERRVADFADAALPVGDFQLEYRGNYNVTCFILDRVRASASVFGDFVRNDETTRKFTDLNVWGYDSSLAFVSAHKNEIGVRYHHSETERPHDPTVEDVTNQRIEGYTSFKVGNYLDVTAAVGAEREERDLGKDDTGASAALDVTWRPTYKVTTHIGYLRATEDTTDLSGTTSKTNRVTGDVDWRLTNRVTAGAYAQYEDDKLDSGIGGLTGVDEKVTAVGLSLQHPFFRLVNVRWNAGYTKRESDVALREFESATAGVSLGLGF